MHQDLRLSFDGDCHERIEIANRFRNFRNALVELEIILGKVIGFPLEGGKVKAAEPDFSVMAEQLMACILPLDKSINHFRVQNTSAARKNLRAIRESFVQQAAFAQVVFMARMVIL